MLSQPKVRPTCTTKCGSLAEPAGAPTHGPYLMVTCWMELEEIESGLPLLTQKISGLPLQMNVMLRLG